MPEHPYNGSIMQGFTDYTLAKKAILRSLRQGSLTPTDVCDAHPELVRAARNIGEKLTKPCPVCSHESLRAVRYVYGEELKHLSGRVVYPQGWEEELNSDYEEFRCYSVEVCIDCSWNHLAACYLMGRRYSASSQKRGSRLGRRAGRD